MFLVEILQCWDRWLSSIDCMFERALFLNVTKSLERLAFLINGDIQTTPTAFLIIELCLEIMETDNGTRRYLVK